jgi:hypothetical protein
MAEPQTFTIPDYIRKVAEEQGLDPAIALGVAEKESSFNPELGRRSPSAVERCGQSGRFSSLPRPPRSGLRPTTRNRTSSTACAT